MEPNGPALIWAFFERQRSWAGTWAVSASLAPGRAPPFPDGRDTLAMTLEINEMHRVCITSLLTDENDLKILLDELDALRSSW